ncbi:MAG: hypothetical protein WC472_01840 [Candidatus Paceibacterota bacterium]
MTKKTIYTSIGIIVLILIAVGAYFLKNPATENNQTKTNILQDINGNGGTPREEGGIPPEGGMPPEGGTPPTDGGTGGSAPAGGN